MWIIIGVLIQMKLSYYYNFLSILIGLNLNILLYQSRNQYSISSFICHNRLEQGMHILTIFE